MVAQQSSLTKLTAKIVSAYVENNAVQATDLPALIASIQAAIASLAAPAPTLPPPVLRPAVPITKSVTPDYIISLEDGRRLKMLKRYLRNKGMTPEDYRAKWGLPDTYPMTAPNYAKARSKLAVSYGLGGARWKTPEARQAAKRTPAP